MKEHGLARIALAGVLALATAGCPGRPDVRPDDPRDEEGTPDAGTPDAGTPDGVAQDDEAAPPLRPVERPRLDPDAPPPCDSHTACYLAAKEAHATGERAGYLLALEKCEYYRGSYQLEKFYGLCLLLLADAYRHLDNFAESRKCYRRFLDAHPDEKDLALQARAGLDEVTNSAQTPHAYHDYLQAVSLLTRHGHSSDPGLIERARELLVRLQSEQPDWALAGNVDFLLGQIGKLLKHETEE